MLKEIIFFAALMGAALVFGLIMDNPFLCLSLALVFYLSFHFYHLYRLTRWLEKKQLSSLPDIGGVWGELYYGIYALNELSKKHKRHMGNILNQYRKTTETLPDATIIINDLNQIVWRNKAAKQFFNLMKSDYGRRIDNILRHPEFTAFLNRQNDDTPLRFEYRREKPYVFLLRLLPYQENNRLLIARDITQLADLENSRYDLITNTSHELKTPLTVIRGYVESLLDSEKSLPKRRALQHIDQQTQRLLRTINDFLIICKLGEQNSTLKEKNICIPDLLKQLVAQAQTMYGTLTHKITLDIKTDKNILGVESEIKSAFENLIINAIHYTENNGTIELTWADQPDNTVYLEVLDNGIGIPGDALRRVTERFYRANNHQNKQGSGLGLSIVQKVMDKYQGELHIDSIVGTGSRFRCVFPATRTVP